MTNTFDEPYGFITPDGVFHPVEWGEHTEYAYRYIDNNGLQDDFYKWWRDETTSVYESPTDYLVYKHGWLLLHSPGYGLTHLTHSDKEMTKAQRETLFDYYLAYGRENDAMELYNDQRKTG